MMTIHVKKALQIHRSRAMLRDEFQAAHMSLIRDTPPARSRFSEEREARNFR
jgi:hypothetical protein